MHLTLADAVRALPDFRGKGRVAQFLRRRLLKSLAPSEALQSVRLRDGSNMILDVRSNTEWSAFYTGRYDELLPLVLELLPAKCAVLDVGANIGFYTIPIGLKLRSKGGRCVAFEPMPANYARLRQNVLANGIGEIVQTLQLALGEKNQEITLLVDENDGATTGNAARVAYAALDDGQRERKPVKAKIARLDDCADQLELGGLPCRFIKVDIEGSEPYFFQGAAGFLRDHKPLVLAEVNPVWLARNGLGPAEYFDIFGPLDYRAFVWRNRRWVRISKTGASFPAKGDHSVLFVPPDVALERLRRS
jgi:FkbM family methyltransferase